MVGFSSRGPPSMVGFSSRSQTLITYRCVWEHPPPLHTNRCFANKIHKTPSFFYKNHPTEVVRHSAPSHAHLPSDIGPKTISKIVLNQTFQKQHAPRPDLAAKSLKNTGAEAKPKLASPGESQKVTFATFSIKLGESCDFEK